MIGGGSLRSTLGTIITSTSTSPRFTQCTSNELEVFIPTKLAESDFLTGESFAALSSGSKVDALYCRILSVGINGSTTFFETISLQLGVVSIIMFGKMDEDASNTLSVADIVLFFDLIKNVYNGRTNLKFGTRTSYFKLNQHDVSTISDIVSILCFCISSCV